MYYKKASDTEWATLQTFNTNTSVKFTPAKAVKYQVCVKVKDGKGTIVKRYFDLTVK